MNTLNQLYLPNLYHDLRTNFPQCEYLSSNKDDVRSVEDSRCFLLCHVMLFPLKHSVLVTHHTHI